MTAFIQIFSSFVPFVTIVCVLAVVWGIVIRAFTRGY